MRTSIAYTLIGAAAGLLNGLFGAGGGIIVVPLLERLHLKPQQAHATSLAIILPLSVASAISFWMQGIRVPPLYLLWLLPAGFAGAWLGSKWLPHVRGTLLQRIFGVFLVISGARLIWFR